MPPDQPSMTETIARETAERGHLIAGVSAFLADEFPELASRIPDSVVFLAETDRSLPRTRGRLARALADCDPPVASAADDTGE